MLKLEDIKNITSQEELEKLQKEDQKPLTTEIETLKSKNVKLVEERAGDRGLKDKLEKAENDLKESQEKVTELEGKVKSGDGEAFQDMYKAEKLKREEAEKTVNELKSAHAAELQNLNIRTQAQKLLGGMNADPKTLDVATSLLIEGAKVVDDLIIVGDKSFEDHAKAWGESDLGKKFLLADQTGGGNSPGGGQPGNTNEWEVYFQPATKNLTKQAELEGKDPKMYAELSQKYAPGATPPAPAPTPAPQPAT